MPPTPTAPTHPLVSRCTLPDAPVGIAWGPPGAGVVVLGAEGTAWWIDPATAAPRHHWVAHTGGGFQVAWQPGGGILATSGQDGRIALWEPSTGTLLAETQFPAAWVEHLRWSPDGRLLAAAGGREVWVMDPAGVRQAAVPARKSTVAALAWSPDSRRLAIASYGGVSLFDAGGGTEEGVLEWKSSLISLAWSPDGRWIVAGTQDQAVQVWELPFRPGTELAMSGYPGKVRELAWHHGGRILATAGADAVLVWNCGGRGPAGTTPRQLEGHATRVTRLAFQHRGHALASGTQDGTVFLWNAGKSSTPLRQSHVDGTVAVLEWATDDSLLAIGCHDGTIGFAGNLAV